MQNFDHKKRQILDRVDVLQVVSEHVRLKRSGNRWVGLCCFHNEKTPSFTVSPEQGFFKCFGCGKGGDVFTFVQMRENIPFAEAFRLLADRAGIDLGDQMALSNSGEQIGRADLVRANAWALQHFRANLVHETRGKAAREYLVARQVSDAFSEKFELGLALDAGDGSFIRLAAAAGFSMPVLLAADLARHSDDGRAYETFRNRLMFPIKDATGRVVGFGGRTLVDHQAKYINTRQTALFDKGKGLYAIQLAREAIDREGRAVLVEGYLDCLAVHQAGFSETVAVLGTALTESQVDLLRRYSDETILLFDSDQAGEAAADRAIEMVLPKGLRVRLARIPDGKDPSDFLSRHGAEAFRDVLNKAVDALEFKWIQTLARFDAETTNARRGDAVGDFIRIVAAACRTGAVDAIQRGLLVNQVAHLLKMDRAEVAGLMSRAQAERPESSSVPTSATKLVEPVGPPSEEQAAWSHWLGAVMNEPGLLASEDSLPEIERIRDARDRRIAGWVIELVAQLGEFRLSDVLCRCDDQDDLRRVSEVAEQGARRGNFEATFRVAMGRIRREAGNRMVEPSVRILREATAEQIETGVVAEHLSVVSNGTKKHRHFAPRRMIRTVVGSPLAGSETVDGG